MAIQLIISSKKRKHKKLINLENGQHIQLATDEQLSLLQGDKVSIAQSGNNLLLRNQKGEVVTLDNFYNGNGSIAENLYSVMDKDTETTRFVSPTSASPRTTYSPSHTLAFETALKGDMAGNGAAMVTDNLLTAPNTIDNMAATAVPSGAVTTQASANATSHATAGSASTGSMFGGLATGGLVGISGVILVPTAIGVLALSGSSGGSASAASSLLTISNTVNGLVSLGAVLSNNGLNVELYQSNGTTLLGTATVDNSGRYSLNVGSYSGVVFAKLHTTDSRVVYLDEATGDQKSLFIAMLSMGTIPTTAGVNTVTLNITPLTTVAALRSGLTANNAAITLTATQVDANNGFVAGAFGLGSNANVSTFDVQATLNADGTPNANANAYGKVLAALSGMDKITGSTQATILQLAAGLTLSADNSRIVLGNDVQNTLLSGAFVAQQNTKNPQDVLTQLQTTLGVDTRKNRVFLLASGAQNGLLNVNDVVTVMVMMPQAVRVTGTPQFALNISGTVVQANYSAGSGTANLIFTYTILASQNDSNGISIAANSLSLNGGTILDSSANTAVALTNDAWLDNQNFRIDNMPPSAPGLSLASGISNGATSSEAVSSNGVVVVTAESGATVTVRFTNMGKELTKTITGTGGSQNVVLQSADLVTLGDGTVTVSVRQTDAAGNVQTDSPVTAQFVLDTSIPPSPTLSLGINVSDGATSREAVSGAGVVVIGATSGFLTTTVFTRSGGGAVTKTLTGLGLNQPVVLQSADISTLGDGVISVTSVQTDVAGNVSAPRVTSFVLDTISPTVSSTAFDGIRENNINVGLLTANETVTWAVGTGADSALFNVDANGNIAFKVAPDYENPRGLAYNATSNNDTYTVNVIATDSAGNTTTQAVRVNVINVNEPPVIASPIGKQYIGVNQNFALDLSQYFSDPDSAVSSNGEVLSYSVTGLPSGLTLNNRSISGSVANTGDYTVTVTVRDLIGSTDTSGLSAAIAQTFVLGVHSAPVITKFSVESAGNSRFGKQGDTLTFSVTMSEAVTVTGLPRLTFMFGSGASVNANYVSGSGTKDLLFSAPAPAGDATSVSLGFIVVSDSDVIRAASGASGLIASSAVGQLASYTLDNTPPLPPTIALNASSIGGVTSAEAVSGNGIFSVSAESGATLGIIFNNGTRSVSKTMLAGAIAQSVILMSNDLTVLGDGVVSVNVFATDIAGNVSVARNTSFILDTTVLPPILTLGMGVSSGATSSEAVSSSGVVSVSTESGALVQVLFKGSVVSVAKTYTATSSAAQAITLSSSDILQLNDGTITVSVTVSDLAGNTNNATTSFVLDTAALPPTLALGTGVSNGATSAEATSANGVLRITGETGAMLEVIFVHDAVRVTKILTATGSSQAVTLVSNDLVALQDGTIAAFVLQRDLAGNESAQNITSFILDTTAPPAPTLALNTGVSDGVVSSEAISSNGVVTVSANSGLALSVAMVRDSAHVLTKFFTGTGSAQIVTLSIADVQTLGDGSIAVTAATMDVAGNTTSVSTHFVLDTVALTPVLSLGVGVSNGATSAEATASSGVVTVGVEVGATAVVTFSNAAVILTKTLSNVSGSPAVVLTASDISALGNGIISVVAVQTNSKGNPSALSSTSFSLDTVAPSAPQLTLNANATDSVSLQEATAFAGILSVQTENGALLNTVFTRAAGSVSLTKTIAGTGGTQAIGLSTADIAVLGNGAISVSVTTTDLAGNVQTATPSVTSFVLDTTLPVVSGLTVTGRGSDGTVKTTLGVGDQVVVTATFSKNVTVGNNANYTFNLDSDKHRVASYVSGSGSNSLIFSYTIVAGDVDSVGGITANANSLLGSFVDSAGNAAVNPPTSAINTGNNALTVSSTGVDTTLPSITGIFLSATTNDNHYLKAGDVLTAVVVMSEDTTVTGTPQLALTIGASTVTANYASGSNGNQLSFIYTILNGQSDTSGVSIPSNALSLNGGTLLDTNNNAANLSSNVVADNINYLVDSTPPTVQLTYGSFVQDIGSASVTPNELGTVYLVNTSVAVNNLASITNAADNLWNAVTVNTANAVTPISYLGLSLGAYKAYMVDLAGNLSAASDRAVYIQGAPVIDLGSYGKLIAPVQVGGNWYYYWDRSGDGTIGNTGNLNDGKDYVTHDVLDGLFNNDINGVANNTVKNADNAFGTTNTYRYAWLNGYHLALPTYGQGTSSVKPGTGSTDNTGFAAGTAVEKNTITPNPVYTDLLSIWDAYNGTGTSTNANGNVPSWNSGLYWSATDSTTSGLLGGPGHARIFFNSGYVFSDTDTNGGGSSSQIYVALQVLPL